MESFDIFHAYVINARETPALKLSNIYKQLSPNLNNKNNNFPPHSKKKKKQHRKNPNNPIKTNKQKTHTETNKKPH